MENVLLIYSHAYLIMQTICIWRDADLYIIFTCLLNMAVDGMNGGVVLNRRR